VPTIRANGLDIGYDVHGAGPPLVLLHGATSLGREDYAAQLPSMSRAFLVHLPDARGHGRTRWDAANGFEADWLVDDLAAFVDALGLDSFHLLGFSMGAMTALQFGARWPGRLRTLIVVGITTLREPRASVGRRQMDPERIISKEPAFAATLARRHDAGQRDGAWQSARRNPGNLIQHGYALSVGAVSSILCGAESAHPHLRAARRREPDAECDLRRTCNELKPGDYAGTRQDRGRDR